MSPIIEAIERISIIAEQKNYPNLPGDAIYQRYLGKYRRLQPQDLTEEQLEIVDEYFHAYQPRLTLAQIKEFTKPYRFKLPREFYDLYQIGNGCLPIGISPDSDWDSIYNYSYFPDVSSPLWNIHNIMSYYNDSLIHDNPRLLCICAYGDESGLFLVGNETEQKTASVVWTYGADTNDDIANMKVFWSSLTNMMLAYAKRYEELYQGNLTEERIKAIYKKYSSDSEIGFCKFYYSE